MSVSPILSITEIAPTQDNKYITHNDAIAALEASTNAIYTNTTVGAGPVGLTEEQATRNYVYVVGGASGTFNIVFPATVGGSNAKRVFAVRNAGATHTVIVKASMGSGPTVSVPAGETAIVYQDYQDMYALGRTQGASSMPYDVGFYFPDKPGNGDEIMKFVATRAFTLDDAFAGSRCHTGVNPTSTVVLTVRKNGGVIGTITISNVGGATFATSSPGIVSFVIGDRISVDAPSPQDTTFADFSIVFLGTRV